MDGPCQAKDFFALERRYVERQTGVEHACLTSSFPLLVQDGINEGHTVRKQARSCATGVAGKQLAL